ncbi:MAG: Asp-tRNA(Asn)/Glu-tRNA(Gln) amidotransferase subunit GatA [Planctomycetota bacterium]|nr:Asp-tRNA(Asn)/Glu-tRNA(Gln) amidotransferase subunit GatA [Planctomycetota bacterium]
MTGATPRTITPAHEIASQVSAGARSARDVTAAALREIASGDREVHAFLETFEDKALRDADAVDARIRAGEKLPLAGVPVAIKDNLCLEWGKTTCASKMLAEFRSPYTATCVRKLLDAGAVIVGKANLDEFAMGGSTEHSAFGPTRNPWDLSRVPGGSSGGSAAAVAAGFVPLSLGSDTGGSIRQPAGLCGLVGIKPTYGRVSRFGLVAFASSLDQVGPLSTCVRDSALALSVICGQDARDATSSARPVPDFAAGLDEPVRGLTLGVPRQARSDANHPAVAAEFERAIERFRGLGAKIVDIDLPMTDHGIAAYYIVAPAEASSNLARFDGIRYGTRAKLAPGEDLLTLYTRSRAEGFGPEVQRRIMLGTHVLSSGYADAYYVNALKVRRLIKRDYDRAFERGCHAVLMPPAPSPAFKLGEKLGDPLALYLEDLYTVTVNLAGLPGITVPSGSAMVEGRELPIGIQLVGPAFEESSLLRIARQYEASGAWMGRVAPRG